MQSGQVRTSFFEERATADSEGEPGVHGRRYHVSGLVAGQYEDRRHRIIRTRNARSGRSCLVVAMEYRSRRQYVCTPGFPTSSRYWIVPAGIVV